MGSVTAGQSERARGDMRLVNDWEGATVEDANTLVKTELEVATVVAVFTEHVAFEDGGGDSLVGFSGISDSNGRKKRG